MQDACHYEISKYDLACHESLSSSMVKAPDRCMGGHEFDSRRGLRFFFVPRSCQLNIPSFSGVVIFLQHTRIAKKCNNLFFSTAFRLRVWVSPKSTARSNVPSYFIGYFDAVNSDYFSQRRHLPALILVKGLHFPVRPKMQIYLH